MEQKMCGMADSSIFMTLHRGCWGVCAAKVPFSRGTQVIFFPIRVGCCGVALWIQPCGRRTTEVGVLVTIKMWSAILVQTFCVIVTFSGELVALPAYLDHQKHRKRESCDILTLNVSRSEAQNDP